MFETQLCYFNFYVLRAPSAPILRCRGLHLNVVCGWALFAASKSDASKPASAPRKVSPTLTKELPISADLQVIVGVQQISRGQASKKLWEYIKAHNLQNPNNKREISCDAKLKKVFDGRDKVGFLDIGKLMSPHFLETTT